MGESNFGKPRAAVMTDPLSGLIPSGRCYKLRHRAAARYLGRLIALIERKQVGDLPRS
jgi:hypothetical protein